jgi:hypothetical protein
MCRSRQQNFCLLESNSEIYNNTAKMLTDSFGNIIEDRLYQGARGSSVCIVNRPRGGWSGFRFSASATHFYILLGSLDGFNGLVVVI